MNGRGLRIQMRSDRHKKLSNELERILAILIAQYQPEKIILFGSLATGDWQAWSDVDLAIIKNTDETFLQRSKQVALMCRPSVGVDFLVYTPAEFQQMIAEKNPFVLTEILEKGKVLYDRHAVAAVA